MRRLAEEQGKAVVVIEHDLAVLDFLADNVHLLYGKEAAYGVVALPRGVRVATIWPPDARALWAWR